MTGRLIVSADASGVVIEDWRDGRCVAAASLPPQVAIDLARDLLNAAAPHYGRTVPASSPARPEATHDFE